MARRVIGLDVGTYSIKVFHLENSNRTSQFSITAYAEKVLADFILEEAPEDTRPMLQRQQEAALLSLKLEGFFDEGTIVTGLSGVDAQVRSLPVPFTNKKKIQAVLGGLLDAQIPLDFNELVTSWSLQKPVNLQNSILLAFAKKNSVKNYLKLLKESGAEPRYLTHKAAGLIDILQHLMRKDALAKLSRIAVVDLGHQSTSVCVGTSETLLLARTVLRGEQDVTKLLSEKLHLSLAEAEKAKRERGFIETETDKAKMLEQHLMSEALKDAYQPVVRELRQINLALEAKGEGQIAQVYLVGGGSKLKNLDHYLTEMLRIKTNIVSHLDFSITPTAKIACLPEAQATDGTAALASSYALYGCTHNKNTNHFDFRKEEFVWRGELSLLRKRTSSLVAWGMVVFVLLLNYGAVKNWSLGKQLGALNAKESSDCSSVLSRKVASGAKCLSLMKDLIAGKGFLKIPEFSAADTYLQIAKNTPPALQLKATEVDITDAKIRISGETSGFEMVDGIVQALSKVPCVTDVDKGRATQTDSFVRFQITADLNCHAADEDKKSLKKRSKRK